MRGREKPTWSLSDGDRQRLQELLGAIDPDSPDLSGALGVVTDLGLVEVLDFWQRVGPGWQPGEPSVPCYCTKDGWLVGRGLLEALRGYAEAGA